MLLIPVTALLGYYLLLFLVQRWLLYPAPRGASPVPPPRDAEPVRIETGGTAVHAWFLPPVPQDALAPAILFFHGNGERAGDWLSMFQAERSAGLAILAVEYPGYADAPGSPSQASLTDAALAAFDWLKARDGVNGAALIAYGRSLGGGVAARLATRRPVAALILESSFTSVRAFAWRYLAPGFLVRDPFDTVEELDAYQGPLLVLHGEQDEIAPFAHGRALAAAKPGSQFVTMPCGHNDCERPAMAVLAFLRSHHLVAAPQAP